MGGQEQLRVTPRMRVEMIRAILLPVSPLVFDMRSQTSSVALGLKRFEGDRAGRLFRVWDKSAT